MMRTDLLEKHNGAWRKIETRWETAIAQWQDVTQRRFEEQFWSEMARFHSQTHKEMSSLLETLARAEQFLKSQDTSGHGS